MQQGRLLRIAFVAGAVSDALAILPMVVAPLAKLMWGFEDPSGACQRPVERRFVAALTILVIWGLVLTEVVAVLSGVLAGSRMLPTWCVQAVLLGVFASAFHHRTVERCLAARHGAPGDVPAAAERRQGRG